MRMFSQLCDRNVDLMKNCPFCDVLATGEDFIQHVEKCRAVLEPGTGGVEPWVFGQIRAIDDIAAELPEQSIRRTSHIEIAVLSTKETRGCG